MSWLTLRDQELKTDQSLVSSRWGFTSETFYQEIIGGAVGCLKGDKLSRAIYEQKRQELVNFALQQIRMRMYVGKLTSIECRDLGTGQVPPVY